MEDGYSKYEPIATFPFEGKKSPIKQLQLEF